MAHPFQEHKQHKVERSRVAKMTKGYASGGGVHSDEAADIKLIKSKVKKSAMRMTGGAVKQRADKRARGGRTKMKKGTTVNIINSPQHPPAPPMMPPPGLAGAMPPRPPMAGPPMPPPGAPPMPPGGAMPSGGPMMPPRPGIPPGMPMRARGGRIKRDSGGPVSILKKAQADNPDQNASRLPSQQGPTGLNNANMRYNRGMGGYGDSGGDKDYPKRGDAYKGGGRVKDGPAYQEGLKAGTQVQHSDGKSDGKDIGRGRVVTFRAGGKVGQTSGTAGPGVSYKPTEKRTKEPLAPEVKRAMGGKIEAPKGVEAASKLPGGSGGGEARLAKEHRAERNYKRA